jgi:hypothetical protein
VCCDYKQTPAAQIDPNKSTYEQAGIKPGTSFIQVCDILAGATAAEHLQVLRDGGCVAGVDVGVRTFMTIGTQNGHLTRLGHGLAAYMRNTSMRRYGKLMSDSYKVCDEHCYTVY